MKSSSSESSFMSMGGVVKLPRTFIQPGKLYVKAMEVPDSIIYLVLTSSIIDSYVGSHASPPHTLSLLRRQ